MAQNSTSDNLKFKFVRSDLLPESGESRIKSIMGLIRESRGCIVDLYKIKEDERTSAQYIIGENEAFKALTDAVQKSRISAKTTQFSPYSVVGRQNTFFNAINDLMSHDVHPETFERIITANNSENFNEISPDEGF